MQKTYSLREEIANSVIHGIGAALSVAGLTLLVAFAIPKGDPWRTASVSIYGATAVLLFLCSTLYHSFQNPRVKHIFKIADHSAIFLFIAGSYTPFTLVSLRGTWGWTLFGLIWTFALAGVAFKLFFVYRYKIFSTLAYVLMGWLCVIAIKPILAAVATGGLILMAAGGLLYTAGVPFYACKRIPYNHAIWHVFVLAASICHYFAIYFYVLPA